MPESSGQENHCGDHGSMLENITKNGFVIERVDAALSDAVTAIFKNQDKLKDSIAANHVKVVKEIGKRDTALVEAIGEIKLSMAEKETAQVRSTFGKVIKYGSLLLKSLIVIIIFLTGGQIIVSDTKTVFNALNAIANVFK